MPRALTIAGSDSGGGAGIQADLKTFSAFGVYGMSVITAVTAQNTLGVGAIQTISPAVVEEQIVRVVEDIGVDAVKTGMLATEDIVRVVARLARTYAFSHLVVDPVIRAKGGDPLLEPDAEKVLREELLPLAEVATPNIPEAESLVGFPIRSIEDQIRAAERLRVLGVRYAVVKGGHGEGETVEDVVLGPEGVRILRHARIPTRNTHGTGCTFASAIAAGLARGYPVMKAIVMARAFVQEAIRHALPLGRGHGPLNHLFAVHPFNRNQEEDHEPS